MTDILKGDGKEMKKRFIGALILVIIIALLVSCSPDVQDNSTDTHEDTPQAGDAGTTEGSHDDTGDADTGDAETGDDGTKTEPTAASFEAKEYRFTGGFVRYWLYTPVNASDNMPLVVYLHGGSGKGDDLELITNVDGFPQYLRDGKCTPDAYVMIPQVSSASRGWGESKADVVKLISFITKEYHINEKRISLTGHSMGGTGAWMLALAYPGLFSAVAPLSGSVELTDANINKLKNMPVWAVVGTEDTIVDPQSSIHFVTELAKVSPDARLTTLDGADHFAVPSRTYLSDLHLIEWLISQERS